MDRGLNDARRKMRTFARDQMKVSKAISGFALGVGASVGGRVTDFVTSGAEGVVDFERSMVRLQIASRKTTEQMGSVRSAIDATSRSTGVSREEVLKGAQAWVDLAGAEALTDDSMKLIARTSQATGTSMKDVVTMIYSLHDAGGIDMSQMESTLSGLNNLSKDGAVHFNQMAGEIIALLPQAARYGMTGRQGAIEFGAMFQVIREGSKDAADTSTKMDAMMRGMKLHADRFAESGVHIFNVGKDGTKSFRGMRDIIDQISKSSLMKDPQKLAKAFGRGEGEAGEYLVSQHIAKMEELINAGQNTTSIGDDLSTMLDSPIGKMDAAINSLKLALVETFTPERIKAFSEAIADAAAHISELVAGLGKVFGFLGTLYSVGRKVRGLLPGGDGHLSYGDHDVEMATGDAYGKERAKNLGWSDQEYLNRQRSAKDNIASVDAHNSAIDSIMAAERDESSTPASIYAAMAAKYATGPGSRGAYQAGSSYIKATGYEDPVEREQTRLANASSDAATIALLTEAIQGVKLVVNLDGNQVSKGVDNSMAQRKGAAKSGR